MESARELKPCPFCGGPAERVNIDSTDEHEPNCGGSYIFCPSCLTSSKVVFGEKIGLEEAWNMRTTHDRVLEACETAIRKECADRAVDWNQDVCRNPDKTFKIDTGHDCNRCYLCNALRAYIMGGNDGKRS